MANIEKTLLGAKGITFLTYVGAEPQTKEVVDLLHRCRIIRNKDVAYAYTNDLERKKLVKTVRKLKGPGPPKIRTANLEPIFQTISYYRIWKGIKVDDKKLSKEDEQKMIQLFKTISPLMDYFPQYVFLSSSVSKKSIRNLRWTETLSIFLEFCFRVVETCWQTVNVHNLKPRQPSAERYPLQSLLIAPQTYIHEAYQKKLLTTQTILNLASFSISGIKDIYRETFLKELYLAFIGLRNPAEACAHVMYAQNIIEAVIEDQLNDIGVSALRSAIVKKAIEEESKLMKKLEKIAEHKVRDEILNQIYDKKEDVEQSLRDITRKLKLNMSTKDLMDTLVNIELIELLKGRIEQLKPAFRIEKASETS